ncbi:helix-turn-helix domain-containing protein [Pirellulaceae bacterium SH449]
MEETFTPKQIAQALQVSESSVKRWCDRGVIQTHRTLGGHRRISLAQLMEFLESTNRKVIDPNAIGTTELSPSVHESYSSPASLGTQGYHHTSPTVEGEGKTQTSESSQIIPFDNATQAALRETFLRAIISGDENEARKIVSRWYAAGHGIVSVADQLIGPTFRSIGDSWACGDMEIYQERRGCEICIRLIHELRRLQPDPLGSSPLAMGGTASGDQYQLPNLLVEMVFRESGWRSINLGNNLPFTSLLSAARKHMPKIFWLSVSYVPDEERFVADCTHFAQSLPKGVVFVVGGGGIYEELRRRIAYSSYCDNMAQLANLARTIKAGVGSTFKTI